jgi:hypothetical protein
MTIPTAIKLNYVDIGKQRPLTPSGGRAEPIRLALTLGGVKFEDNRFAFSQFKEFAVFHSFD